MNYPYCSCGGLKVDNDTLKVNEQTGELYVSAGAGEEVPVYKTFADIGYTTQTGSIKIDSAIENVEITLVKA